MTPPITSLRFEDRPSLSSSLLTPTHPLPTLLIAHPEQQELLESFFAGDAFAERATIEGDAKTWQDVNDKFTITSRESDLAGYIHSSRNAPEDTSSGFQIITTTSSNLTSKVTPLFDSAEYWSSLDLERKRVGRLSKKRKLDEAIRMGDVLFYTEAIGSTQTMLEKNTFLLHTIPTPLLSLATFQLQGRGRGQNNWVSPPGCLQFSLTLSLPQTFPSNKLVFIQYLAALSICEALDESGKLGIRIKWPNDIYAEAEGLGDAAGKVDSDDRPLKGKLKIGGILVNTSYVKGEWKVIIGCGINILNNQPTTSISELYQVSQKRLGKDIGSEEYEKGLPTMEGSLAKIMVSFEAMWERFCENKGDFGGFLDEYLGRWLHTNQKVTLTTTTPPETLLIKSITLDYGLLRCIKVSSDPSSYTHASMRPDYGGDDRTSYGFTARGKKSEEEFVDLQPDGNSFDMMSGMIKKKV